jgi:RHS repeat-associated protein
MTSVAKTGIRAGTDTFSYDNAGNMKTRTVDGVTSTYTFNSENQFAKAVVQKPEGAEETTHFYDANGGLLIRREPTGTTLYAAGQEFKLAGGNVTCTRYYSHGGAAVAARTPGSLTLLAADHQGSANITIDAATGKVTRRWYTPYGADRNTVPWPTDRGFLGKQTNASTALVDMGAREYDPVYGSFISPDPIARPGQPRSYNPYAYADHTPITAADPDGLMPRTCLDVCGGADDKINERNKAKPRRAELAKREAERARRNVNGAKSQAQQQAQEAADAAKQKVVETAKALGKIAMDELGITAALDCFTTGDLGSCLETGLNIAASFVGGLAGKLLAKYAFKWGKAAALAKKIWGLLGDLVNGAKGWIKNSKLARALASADDVAASCAKHSFDPDTPVRMADGTDRPIKDLKPGDVVLAADPKTGETAAEEVTKKHVNYDVDLTDLTISTPLGEKVIKTTQHHPFWSETSQEWIEASKLQPWERLRTANGERATVAWVTNHVRGEVMHDLTVDRIHTYYVVAGTTPVLVHNCGLDNAGADDLYKLATDGGSPSKLSPAGRGIQKHSAPNRPQAQRDKYDYGANSNRDRNEVGDTLIQEILTDPNASRTINHGAPAHYGGSQLDIRMGNGIGARWSMRGGGMTFEGFL